MKEMYLRPAVVGADVLEARGIFPLAAVGAALGAAASAAAATSLTGPVLVGAAAAYGATKVADAARVVGPALVNTQLRGAMRALLLNGLPSFMKFADDH